VLRRFRGLPQRAIGVYQPATPLVARAATGNGDAPETAEPLAATRRRDSDVLVITALTIAATAISAYDVCLLALHL
jgi:hypothetical protein